MKQYNEVRAEASISPWQRYHKQFMAIVTWRRFIHVMICAEDEQIVDYAALLGSNFRE